MIPRTKPAIYAPQLWCGRLLSWWSSRSCCQPATCWHSHRHTARSPPATASHCWKTPGPCNRIRQWCHGRPYNMKTWWCGSAPGQQYPTVNRLISSGLDCLWRFYAYDLQFNGLSVEFYSPDFLQDKGLWVRHKEFSQISGWLTKSTPIVLI